MKHSEDGKPVCLTGHVIETEFYTVNPLGGYGRDEVLCCVECIRKPELAAIRARMLEAGATELA